MQNLVYNDKINRKKSFADYLNEEENELMELLTTYAHPKEKGIIGINVAKRRLNGKKVELARKPSSIYWNGLRTHRIIRTPFSLTGFTAMLDNKEKGIANILRSEKGQSDDKDASAGEFAYLQNTLAPPPNWKTEPVIQLTREEAEHLHTRFTTRASGEENLLQQILKRPDLQELFMEKNEFKEFYKDKEIELSVRLDKILETAYLFSELMYGAHLAYNLAVQMKLKHTEEVEKYRTELMEWQEENLVTANEIDLDFLWQITQNTPAGTKEFVIIWKKHVQEFDFAKNVPEIVKFITDREILKKRKRARLYPSTIPQSVTDWVGLKHLDYRFTTAKNIVHDILNPIN